MNPRVAKSSWRRRYTPACRRTTLPPCHIPVPHLPPQSTAPHLHTAAHHITQLTPVPPFPTPRSASSRRSSPSRRAAVRRTRGSMHANARLTNGWQATGWTSSTRSRARECPQDAIQASSRLKASSCSTGSLAVTVQVLSLELMLAQQFRALMISNSRSLRASALQ